MAHGTLIGGTAYEIGGGRTLVGGTGYKIDKGRTLVGGTGYDISFGLSISELAVGDSVFLRVNGTLKEFIIVHKGNPSTSMYDTSCNGVWVMMKDVYTTGQWHSTNNNTYSSSTVHSYLNGTFLGLINSVAQTAIKQVKIPYVTGAGSSKKLYSKTSGLSTRVFLLSAVEVGCTTYTYTTNYADVGPHAPTDGAKLSYFTKGDTTAAAMNKRIAYMNGSKKDWWMRTPWDNGGVANATYINTGGALNYAYCNKTYGYRPALILDNNTILDPETHEVIGL